MILRGKSFKESFVLIPHLDISFIVCCLENIISLSFDLEFNFFSFKKYRCTLEMDFNKVWPLLRTTNIIQEVNNENPHAKNYTSSMECHDKDYPIVKRVTMAINREREQ